MPTLSRPFWLQNNCGAEIASSLPRFFGASLSLCNPVACCPRPLLPRGPPVGRQALGDGSYRGERSPFSHAISLIKRNLTSLSSHRNVLLAVFEGVCFGNSTVGIGRAAAGRPCGGCVAGIECPVFQVNQAPLKASGFC